MGHYPLAAGSWNDEEYAALQRVISTGNFTMGHEVATMERQCAEWFGSKHCIMVNSGSSANLLMVAALFFRKQQPLCRGDEVIVPAVSWSTTYTPLQQYGLHVKFVDIDLGTLNFDLSALKAAITPKTRAILAVNLLGNPNDFSALQALCREHNLLLLEDNCESMGARFGGQFAGTFGVMGTMSSFFSHHMSTMEGGYVLTDDEELYHIMLSLRAHGWTRNLPDVNHVCGAKSTAWFDEAFRFVLPGYNLRPLEMSGALGQSQLRKLTAFVAERRANAERFLTMMREFPWLKTQQEVGESSWFGFSMILNPESDFPRAALIPYLEQHGIEYRPIVTGNFTKNSVLQWFDYEISGALPHADTLDQCGFFVGNHHYPLVEEILLLQTALRDASRAFGA